MNNSCLNCKNFTTNFLKNYDRLRKIASAVMKKTTSTSFVMMISGTFSKEEKEN
jgi:hypothetical protein